MLLIFTHVIFLSVLSMVSLQTTNDCDEKSCFRYPDACVDSNCTIIYKWTDGVRTTDFIIAGKINTFTNKYLAIGLSKDGRMGNDCVVACKTSGKVHHYFNPYNNPSFLDVSQPSIGITDARVTINNNWLVCQFKRQKNNSEIANYFDLNEKHFVLAAFGDYNVTTEALGGQTRAHEFKINSSRSYNFVESLRLPNQENIVTQSISDYANDCNSEYSCFLSPNGCIGTACKFVYKWKDNGDKIGFVLVARINKLTNRYLAIGFSKDQLMGDDSVVACKSTGNFGNYYNPGSYGASKLIDSSNPSFGISNGNVTQDGDWIICQFERSKTYPISNSEYFDLNDEFYILGSYGDLDVNGGLQYHENRITSNMKVNFTQSVKIVGGKSPDFSKYKAHACLMIIAWILCASTGILVARYFKFLFGEKKFGGVQFWFAVHRPVMIFVPICSLVAFLVILAQSNWSWVSSANRTSFAHSIVGVLALVFSFVQAFIAFFRYDKDHPKRYLFNYVHRTIGILVFVFAISASFLGSIVDVMGLGDRGWAIIFGWTLWYIFAVAVLELIVRFLDAGTIHQFSKPKADRMVLYKFGV